MIWARPLSCDGGALDPAMAARVGLSQSEGLAARRNLERVALLTGLDEHARVVLARALGQRWLGGTTDAGLAHVSVEAFDEWAPELAHDPRLLDAFRRFLALDAPLPAVTIGPRRFEWKTRTFVMGVVNVTPDSFSDGGRFSSTEAAADHGEALIRAGADLLDIGGESTRPGAAPVELEEELSRVVPVVAALARRLPLVPLSVDTSKPEVARRAVEAGAHLINDVTGLQSEEMLRLVAELKVFVCAMHMQGTPRTMQRNPVYDDVVAQVLDGLEATLIRAEAAGVERHRVLVDPGIGFGKTVEHNLFLLKHMAALRLLGAPVLLGSSRKSFLGALTGGKPPEARDVATSASVAAIAVTRGADVVRVHDVASTRDAVAVADAIAQASGGGRRFEMTEQSRTGSGPKVANDP